MASLGMVRSARFTRLPSRSGVIPLSSLAGPNQSLLLLRQGKHEHGVAATGVAEPGGTVAGEAGRPAAPAHRHGNILPAVEGVGDRRGVVPGAALEVPQRLAIVGVIGREEALGVA